VFFLPSSSKEPDRLRFQPNNLFTLSEKKQMGWQSAYQVVVLLLVYFNSSGVLSRG
jgi:hypothetical protein